MLTCNGKLCLVTGGRGDFMLRAEDGVRIVPGGESSFLLAGTRENFFVTGGEAFTSGLEGFVLKW